jgi:hypothetical protein
MSCPKVYEINFLFPREKWTAGIAAFIVSFKRPIKLWRDRKASKNDQIMVFNQRMSGTPFSLRGMYNSRGNSIDNTILSNNMIAFDIDCLQTSQFDAWHLRESLKLLPDKRLSQIIENTPIGLVFNKIDSIFSESEKAQKLLEWIEKSGLSILENGIYLYGDYSIGDYPINEIIENYFESGSGSINPWRMVNEDFIHKK